MVLITIVTGAYKPTYNWGSHIVPILGRCCSICAALLAESSMALVHMGPQEMDSPWFVESTHGQTANSLWL